MKRDTKRENKMVAWYSYFADNGKQFDYIIENDGWGTNGIRKYKIVINERSGFLKRCFTTTSCNVIHEVEQFINANCEWL